MWNVIEVRGDLTLEFRGKQVENLKVELNSHDHQEWTLTAGYTTWDDGVTTFSGSAKTYVFKADGLSAAMELADKVYVPKAQHQLSQFLASKLKGLEKQILAEVGKTADEEYVRKHWHTNVSTLTCYLKYKFRDDVRIKLRVVDGIVTDEVMFLEELFGR
jgi:hypothetical protein